MKKLLPLFLLSQAGAIAAQQDACAPKAPMCYTQDDCCNTYCFGPAQSIANAPVRPYTCNGDWEVTIAGLYWKPQMDGLEFGIETSVRVPDQGIINNQPSNNLIDAQYKSPHGKWDFGFKLGLGYNSACDGWDFGVLWTRFHSTSHTLNHLEVDDNRLLDSFFADFGAGPMLSATSIVLDLEADWSVHLDLVDLSLGREFWVSPKLSLQPFVGLRYADIDQKYFILNRNRRPSVTTTLSKYVSSDNHLKFRGVGLSGGLLTNWHWGCGWSLFGKVAASAVYGKFSSSQKNKLKDSLSPFSENTLFDLENSFRISRGILNGAIGVSWFSLFCDCKYGIGVRLEWEENLFLHQNQQWLERDLVDFDDLNLAENIYTQRTGSLFVGGWTLSLLFDF